MSNAQATVLITAGGLVLTALGILIGFVSNITKKWTRIEDKLEHLVLDKDKAHIAMMNQITADRAANDKRLRELELWVWPRTRRKGDGNGG